MEWQGGNKQRLKYWQWHRSFINGDSNWKIFRVGYPVDIYLSPNWMLSRVRSVKHFFRNALSRAHHGVLVPTSLWLGPIDSLPFATVVFWLHLKKMFLKEKHGKKTPLSTFHCNQLQHNRSACFKTDFPDHFQFNFVQVLTEPLSWRCPVVTSWRSRDRNPGFSAAYDAAARSVVFVFIQINTFTYLRKMSIYQTNSMYVKLYLYSTM